MTENYIYSERIICSCPADDTTKILSVMREGFTG